MSLLALLLLALGVSADAFAVARGKGLAVRRHVVRCALVLATAFAVAQVVMPLIGWLLGSAFAEAIEPFDHWVAFGLLLLIGLKMLWEAWRGDGDEEAPDAKTLTFREVVVLAIATSIDALAVGVSLSFFEVSLVLALAVIGVVTFVLSFAAVLIGHRVGTRFQRPAEVVGGLVLIGIGAGILVEHLG